MTASGLPSSESLDALLARVARPTPRDVARDLLARLAQAPGRWHRCPQRACRRHRRCGSRNYDCLLVVLSREEQTEVLAQLRTAMGR